MSELIEKIEKARSWLKFSVWPSRKMTNTMQLKEQETIDAALRVLKRIAEGDDWFPIETAPRGQVKFLALFEGGAVLVCNYLTDYLMTPTAYSSVEVSPTHWKHIDQAKHIEMLMKEEKRKATLTELTRLGQETGGYDDDDSLGGTYKLYVDGQLGLPFFTKEEAQKASENFLKEGFECVIVHEKGQDDE